MAHGLGWRILTFFGLVAGQCPPPYSDTKPPEYTLTDPASSARPRKRWIEWLKQNIQAGFWAICLLEVLRQSLDHLIHGQSAGGGLISLLLLYLRYQIRHVLSMLIVVFCIFRRKRYHDICEKSVLLKKVVSEICGDAVVNKLERLVQVCDNFVAVGAIAVFLTTQWTNDITWFLTSPEFVDSGFKVWPLQMQWSFWGFVIYSYCTTGVVLVCAYLTVGLFCVQAYFTTQCTRLVTFAVKGHGKEGSCWMKENINCMTQLSVEEIRQIRHYIWALKRHLTAVERNFAIPLLLHLVIIIFTSLVELCGYDSGNLPSDTAYLGMLNDGVSVTLGLGVLLAVRSALAFGSRKV